MMLFRDYIRAAVPCCFIYRCVLITFIVFCINTTSGFAFFCVDKDDSRDGIYQVTQLMDRRDKFKLVLYDNYGNYESSFDKIPILKYKSNKLNAVDEIKINSTIRLFVKRSGPSEESLSDLIYANLKLKKLLDDYRLLQSEQERFRSQIRSISWFDFDLGNRSGKARQKSIGKRYQQIQNDYNQIINKIESRSSSTYRFDTYSKENLAKSLNQLLKQSRVTKSQATVRQKRSILVHDKNGQNLYTDNEQTHNAPPNQLMREKVVSLNDGNDQMPRLFNMLIIGIQYMMSHKVEAIICFLVIIVVFSSLVSSRTK